MRIIPLENAKAGMIVGKSIYGANGQILLREGIELTDKYISHLEYFGVPSLYIKNKLSDDIEVDDVINEKTRLAALIMTKEVVDKAKLGASFNVGKVKEVINNIVDDLLKNPNVVVNLVDIRTHSDYLFAHSVNVAVLAAMVGIGLNYDELKLRNLTVGAMLHDIGKTKIDQEIIHKHQALTQEEKVVLQQHAEHGFNVLRANYEISLSSAHVAFQHHEWFDGSGYPRGLVGTDINEFARIVSIVDVYDELTSGTPYGKQYSVQETVEYLMAGCSTQFDPELVRIFLNRVAIYPTGTEVVLNTGEKGIIIKTHKNFPTRPVVRVTCNQFGRPLTYGYEIDLLTKTTYFITRIIEEFSEEERGV